LGAQTWPGMRQFVGPICWPLANVAAIASTRSLARRSGQTLARIQIAIVDSSSSSSSISISRLYLPKPTPGRTDGGSERWFSSEGCPNSQHDLISFHLQGSRSLPATKITFAPQKLKTNIDDCLKRQWRRARPAIGKESAGAQDGLASFVLSPPKGHSICSIQRP